MNKRDTHFRDIESLVPSQRVSVTKLEDLYPLSPLNSDENILSQPLDEALKLKRNIFERKNFRALNLGPKSESSEGDQCLSSVSDNRFDLESARSKTNSFAKLYKFDQRSPSISQIANRTNKKTLVVDSTSFQNNNGAKSFSKLDQYQSFVQHMEHEEDKKQKVIQDQIDEEQNELKKHIKSEKDVNIGLNIIWTLKAFNIIRLVSRFIQQLKTKTETIKFRLLTQKIFSVIGDLSSNFEFILISRQIKQQPSLFLILKYNFQNRATKYIHYYDNVEDFLSRYIKVIKPDSKFKILWDMLLLLFIVMNIFYIPINISFNINTSGAFEYLFDLLPSWIFVAEILINFNTAYYDKGLMHEDRKSIVKHYIKGNFFWDLVVVIPFLMSNLNIPFVRYTLLLRLTRLQPLMESIEQMLNFEESIQVVVDLFKLVFFLILTGHFCGCAWHFVALQEYDNGQKNWLTDYEPRAFDLSWFDRYIISLYWSVITTVTVGYGDIVPVTTIERIFVIIVTLLLCGAFGYCISNIGNIFKSLSDKKTTYKLKLRQIHQHIRKRGLNLNLSLKVKKYFEYYFKLEQEEESNAEEFISQLTKHLREEVLTDLYSTTLKKSRFLRDNFTESTINNLCQFVKEKKVLPEEVLYSRYDQPTKIWFILTGAIEYVADHKNENDTYEATETFLKKVTQGAVCGEREFITQQPYEYKARALKFTQMACIDYVDFINVISENTVEYETFCMKRDSLLFNPTYKGSGNVCEICEWTHNFISCPFIFLQPNKNKIANKFTSVKFNNRIKFPYRETQKSRCKTILRRAQEAALRIIIGSINDRDYTDEYLQALGFQLVQNENESHSEQQNSESQLSKSPTSSDHEQKKISKKSFGVTTDLRESHDFEIGHQMRRSIINFKRIKFGKEKTKAIQASRIENAERTSEMLESSNQGNLSGLQLQGGKKDKFLDQQHFARRTSNFDECGLLQVSQKFGQQKQQIEPDFNKCYVKEISRNSDASDMKESQTGQIKQRIEVTEKKQHHPHLEVDQRRRKKKTTLVMQNQRGSYLKQKTNHNNSPTLQQTRQFQQLQTAFEQKPLRSSINDKVTLPYSQQVTSQGLIEKQEIQDGGQIDSLQSKILDIVHSSISFELDICRLTIAYFPDYNIDVIAGKIEKYYAKAKFFDKKSFSRSKSNRNLFQRIKPLKVTLKSFQNNSKSNVSIQKNEEDL